MKKKSLTGDAYVNALFKWLRIMRFTLFILLVSLLHVSASVYSQQTLLSVNAKNASVKEVLRSIEDQSDFYFLYKNEEIDVNRKIDFNLSDKSLDEMLGLLFKDTNVKYEVHNRQIVLRAEGMVQQQNIKLSGKVTDTAGQPLPGVTVVVKGTTNGTITNFDGVYSLADVPSDGTIQFSFVGMKMQEISVGGKTSIDVEMEEDAIGIEEVVAIGYGTIKKSDLTGSVSSVKGDVIDAFPTASVSKALQGRIAGVHVIQNTSAPGGTIQVRIRGTNSISGDNSPLWIVDGFPGGTFDANDIESIEVLKDASATAIYGSRGANGVILVTTKSGKTGPTKVEYDGSYGIQTLRNKLDLMNAEEYMLFNNIQQLNDTGEEYFSQAEINSAGEGTDWQDHMFRAAPIHHHSLNISGGNEKTQYLIGGSYFGQEGILLNNKGYHRYILRAKIDHNISKKLNVLFNTNLSRVGDKSMDLRGMGRGVSLFSSITCAPPTLVPYNDDGSYKRFNTVYPFISDGERNPVNYVNEHLYNEFINSVWANLAFTYKPIEDLSIRIAGNVNNTDNRTDNYTTSQFISSTGDASVSTGQSLSLNGEALITYHKTINKIHDLTATAVTTYDQRTYTSLSASGSGFLSDNYETYNIAAASVINTPSTSYSKWVLQSYLGRLNYSYKSKYLATVSFRADGSSRYSAENKWGFFPSGALAWRLTEEGFMKNIDFISNLKLRAGYGETGSTAISPYTTLSMLSTGKVAFDKTEYTYYAPSSRYPGDLKWETTAQTDIGVDVGLFNNRMNITADYYIKNTRDLLNSVQLPRSMGYTNTIMNIGKIQNKGFEFQIDGRVLDQILKWDITANISFNRNKVVKLYGGQSIAGRNFDISILSDYMNIIQEDQPFAVFYGYQEDGYDENGKIKYKDINDDGSISTLDKTIIGDPNPDFLFSFASQLSYKNFGLSFFIQGSQGNDIYSLTMVSQNYDYGFGLNMFREVLYDHWTPETPDAKYPKISKTSSLRASDRFVYDGSYIRLQDVQLSYNIPFEKLGIYFINKGQVYISGQNLLTLTSYPWYDPEVNTYGGGTSVNQGIDLFTFPSSKCITFGVKMKF